MKELIFVYNANSGMWNGMLDSLHKVVSPQTYSCQLCSLTYGLVGMKKEWNHFIRSLNMKVTFHHKDDLPYDFPKGALPCVFIREAGKVTLLVNEELLKTCQTLPELIKLIQERLADFSSSPPI